MAWPEDPYRIGQQMFRKPGPMLTAIALAIEARHQPGAAAMAVAYLPLHRTRPEKIEGPAISFGFRAVAASGPAGLTGLARQADLELARARRHVSVLAGLLFIEQLARLQANVGDMALRAATAVGREWGERSFPVRGRALMIDCGLDLPARSPGHACRLAQISSGAGWEQARPADETGHELAAVRLTQAALMTALLAGWHLGRLAWNQHLDLTEIIATCAWDRFPGLRPPAAP